MAQTAEPRIGDRIEVAGVEWEVKEILPGVKQVKRRAWEIRQDGGNCSYRKIGGKYCILKKVPPPVADYFFK